MDAVIQVEKGVPLPEFRPRGGLGGVKRIYPWERMEVGDSFLFPDGMLASSAHNSARAASYRGREFKVAKVGNRFRCWRIA